MVRYFLAPLLVLEQARTAIDSALGFPKTAIATNGKRLIQFLAYLFLRI